MSQFPTLAYAVLLAALAACASNSAGTPEPGEGLINCDREPPPGAELAQRPDLQIGDTFTYKKGGHVTLALRVVQKNEHGYAVAEASSGLISRYDLDLAQLGEGIGDDPAMQSRLAPADHSLTWPLWVGKRWACNFARQGVAASPMAITAAYHCDAHETIEVGMRKFDCYRIWRRANMGAEQRFFERVSVAWYAPEVGYFVQKVDDGLLTELVDFHRQ